MMRHKIDQRFLRDSGEEVFNGNELLFKGALETADGVHLMTGYPGSPVATFFDVMEDCAPLLRERGIEGRLANNEALAVAAVNGSQMAPLRAMAVFKSVGLHVASDALALANLAGPHPGGGAVIVSGDDPWSESTQVPADSRYLFRHLFVPVLEPSTSQEIKDFVPLAFDLSQASGLYIGYIVTTTLADGGGTVTCRPNHYPLTNANHPFELATNGLNLEQTVLLSPRTGRREMEMPQRYERLARAVRRLGVNRLDDVPGSDDLLIITSGLAWQFVSAALANVGLAERVPVLKLGVTYPLEYMGLEPMLTRFANILVVEERRGFIEEQLAGIAQRLGQRTGQKTSAIWGKQFPGGTAGLPSALGLNVSIVADRMGCFLRAIESPLARTAAGGIEAELKIISDSAKLDARLPVRTPTFCPGCPHRDSRQPAAGHQALLRRRVLDAPALRPAGHRPGLPRRHRLPRDADVRAHHSAHAQLLGHGPGRRHRQRHRSVHHQQAGRVHGRLDLLPLRADRHQQLHRRSPCQRRSLEQIQK